MAGLSTSTFRDVPKIGGSGTGFIVLIVCLVVVVVASSFVILCLVREEGVFSFSHRRHRIYDQPSTTSFPFIYDGSSDRRPWSWRKVFKHFLSPSDITDSSAHGHTGLVPVRGGRGCYQIGSSDSWDHTIVRTTEVHDFPHEAGSAANSPALSGTNPYGHRGMTYNRDSSASTTHLDTSDPRKPSSLSSPSLSQSNRLTSNLEIDRTVSPLPSSSPAHMLGNSPLLRSGSSMSRRAISPLPEPAMPPGIGRTFEGGSKFLEAL